MAHAPQGFHLVARPPGVQSSYTHLVVDEIGLPHLALTEFFAQLQQHYSEQTPLAYLHMLLPYFTYLATDAWRQERGDQWDSPPEAVREAVRDYLLERLGCKVQRHETYETVKLTAHSPSTVKLFLAALKQFYTFVRRVNWYPHPHPLLDPSASRLSELRRQAGHIPPGRPPMPQVSGGSAPTKFRRAPENYYQLPHEDWVPESLDDPHLLQKLRQHASKTGLCLRDVLIITLAAETGARISEILSLTIGDWRARGGRTEVNAQNKGSRHRRSKYLVFTPETAKLLKRYVNGERCVLDPLHCRLEQLTDTAPLFLSTRRRPYSYSAFYARWQHLCRQAHLSLTIHTLRHWNVTEAIRFLYETAKTEVEIQAGKEDLVRYMAWRSPETLNAYNHYFQARRHVAQVLRPLQKRMAGVPAPIDPPPQRKRATRKRPPEEQPLRAHTPKDRQGWGILPRLGTEHL